MRLEPSPAQDAWLRALFSGQYTILGYGGGVGGGKTVAVVMAIYLLCKAFPGSRWVVVRKDLPTMRRTILASFEKYRPRGFVSRVRKDDWTMRCSNGSEILFFPESADTDPDFDRWKGLEVNGFVLEQAEELQFRSMDFAIQRSGRWILPGPHQPPPLVLCTFNPAPGWVKHTFYTPWSRGLLQAPYFFQQALVTDNPHLTPEYIENLKRMSPSEYDRFVRGKWDQLSGRALDDLNPLVHLVERFRVPDHWVHFGCFDWGFRHLFAFGHLVANEDGAGFVVDTVRGQRLKPDGIVDRIRAKVPLGKLEYIDAGWDLWDQHEARSQGSGGPTLYEQFTDLGLPGLRKARRDRVQGLQALRHALAYQSGDGQTTFDPLLRFMKTDGNLWLFDHLGEQMLDASEDVKKTDCDDQGRGGDDGYDMLRYGVAGRWQEAPDQVNPDLDLSDPVTLGLVQRQQRQVSRYGKTAGEAKGDSDREEIQDPELGGWV